MDEKIGWYPHPEFEKWAKPFEDKYKMVDVLMLGDSAFAKYKTRKKDGRHCRFCGRSYPEATFSHEAHLLPRMIGNTDLYSIFECDSCNSKFSLFETDLAYFLGAGRSITGLKDSRLPRGFPGIGLETKSFLFKNKKVLVIHKENAERNAEDGSTTLKYQKPTYTPANIYKLFLKCALSILPSEEVISDFKVALEYLLGDKVLGGAHITMFRFPLTIKMPLHVYTFKKKKSASKLPTYVLSFYFDNFVINFPVLLQREDLKYMNKPINIPIPPPYFIYGNDIDKVSPLFSEQNLSSPVKLKYESEEVVIKFSKSDLEKTTRFDPKTGEETQVTYNPSNSKYFIATEEGTAFSKEELSELIDIINDKFSSEK